MESKIREFEETEFKNQELMFDEAERLKGYLKALFDYKIITCDEYIKFCTDLDMATGKQYRRTKPDFYKVEFKYINEYINDLKKEDKNYEIKIELLFELGVISFNKYLEYIGNKNGK